jgi:tetratricopeptide (TPR) repeat protein
MRAVFFAAVFAVAVQWPAAAQNFDLRYPPTPAQREAVVAMGWSAARDLLGPALKEAYRPGMGGVSGSTGMTAYRQWLTLWKWADLLARSEEDEAAAFLRRFIYEQPGADKPVLIPPGVAPEPDMTPVDEAFARGVLSDPRSRAEVFGKLIPPEIPDPSGEPVAARLDPGLLDSWVADPAFSEMVLATVSSDDYLPGVLWNLQEIARAHPEKFKRHAALALAIAVVYDMRPPAFWPHRQVDPALVPVAAVSPSALFAEWVAANESKSLLTDLATLSPGRLKFVIDAPLSASEYTWARKNLRFPRSNFDRAFSAVPYSTARLKAGAYSWTDPEYTLENILTRGGICVDQAYFAMVAGKARGLPTLFFTGQGSDGGHAWFGYLKAGDRWEMDAGRYENQNYAVGEALDPQSWLPISDHDLKGLAEGFREKAAFAASRDDLVLASLFEELGDSTLAAKALESAIAVCPQNPDAWLERGRFLERSGAPPDARKAHHEAALKQFANRRDLRVRHQLALAGIARELGDTETADALERRIVSQNRRLRADLSVNAAARRLDSLVQDDNLDGAFTEYRSMLRSLRKTGGGSFFYDIVVPFAEILDDAGDQKRALEAVAMARKELRPERDSILDKEFNKLEDVIGSP